MGNHTLFNTWIDDPARDTIDMNDATHLFRSQQFNLIGRKRIRQNSTAWFSFISPWPDTWNERGLQQRVVIVIELRVAWNYEMLFDKQLVNRKLTEQVYELMEISLRSKCITVTS